jgi:hypothetical protein
VKLKLPWRRPTDQPESEPGETRAPSPPELDIKQPRECIYKSFKDDPGPCPRCGSTLRKEYQSYLIATRRGRQSTDSFITGTDFGWLCPACPTLVINPEDVSERLGVGASRWDVGTEFVVLGIVDLDAVPPDKRSRPLGEDDNPVPLVRFSNLGGRPSPKRAASAHKKHKSKKKRKR